MTTCAIHENGSIELYFYGELGPAERARIDAHVRVCGACAEALRELEIIRAALAAGPDVSAPAGGDWTPFMQRLDAAVLHPPSQDVVVPFARPVPVQRRPFAGVLTMAALLAIVALSVFLASQAGRSVTSPPPTPDALAADGAVAPAGVESGLAAVGLRHLERSKLVVLGLAAKEPGELDTDWSYERELASALLTDTRLYRMAAEERGLTALAGVMKDLELVLLQTSMAETTDTAALPQIQRLIQKRGLVQKMDVVGTTGLLP